MQLSNELWVKPADGLKKTNVFQSEFVSSWNICQNSVETREKIFWNGDFLNPNRRRISQLAWIGEKFVKIYAYGQRYNGLDEHNLKVFCCSTRSPPIPSWNEKKSTHL